jgi:hypothetical protein
MSMWTHPIGLALKRERPELAAVDVGQPSDSMTLQAAVQA